MSATGSPRGSTSWRATTPPGRGVTARCGPPSAGAMSCANRRSGCCGRGCPSSAAPSTRARRPRCARTARSTPPPSRRCSRRWPPSPSSAGGPRLRMLDTVREYGSMWLDALGERHTVADRHAARCLRLVRRAHAQWLGPSQADWYGRIAAVHTDLCTALEHLLEADPEGALELAGTVGFFWACCGHLPEARHFVESALARCPGTGPHHARALWALGVALTLQGEYGPARERSAECTRAARRWGDVEDRLDAAYLSGLLGLLTGSPEAAYREVGAALDEAGDRPWGEDGSGASGARARCLLVRVFALTASGRLTEAGDAARDLRARCGDLGESWTRAYVNYQLALIMLLTGDPGAAARHARSMLIGKRGLGDGFGVALGLDVLAAALAALGEGSGPRWSAARARRTGGRRAIRSAAPRTRAAAPGVRAQGAGGRRRRRLRGGVRRGRGGRARGRAGGGPADGLRRVARPAHAPARDTRRCTSRWRPATTRAGHASRRAPAGTPAACASART
ncbi:hypothetical protein ACFQ60_41950 [Streptomyces zhihengii]